MCEKTWYNKWKLECVLSLHPILSELVTTKALILLSSHESRSGWDSLLSPFCVQLPNKAFEKQMPTKEEKINSSLRQPLIEVNSKQTWIQFLLITLSSHRSLLEGFRVYLAVRFGTDQPSKSSCMRNQNETWLFKKNLLERKCSVVH